MSKFRWTPSQYKSRVVNRSGFSIDVKGRIWRNNNNLSLCWTIRIELSLIFLDFVIATAKTAEMIKRFLNEGGYSFICCVTVMNGDFLYNRFWIFFHLMWKCPWTPPGYVDCFWVLWTKLNLRSPSFRNFRDLLFHILFTSDMSATICSNFSLLNLLSCSNYSKTFHFRTRNL